MATFHLELVSPEKIAFTGEVEQVDLPGTEGDFGILAGHSALVATLRPGLMTITAGGTQTRIVILGGLAEVNEKGLTVLADKAVAVADFDREAFRAEIDALEKMLSEKQGSMLDEAIQYLDHYKAIQQAVVSTAMH